MLPKKIGISNNISISFEWVDRASGEFHAILLLDNKIHDIRTMDCSIWDRNDIDHFLSDMFNIPHHKISKVMQTYDEFLVERYGTHED